jgi:hypothetical protein
VIFIRAFRVDESSGEFMYSNNFKKQQLLFQTEITHR